MAKHRHLERSLACSLICWGALCCSPVFGAEQDTDPVIQILRETQRNQSRPLNTVCLHFARLEHPESLLQTEVDALATLIANRLKEQDPGFLRARADIARLGLYGIQKNTRQALKYYLMAAQKGSWESGYNAALMLYQQSRYRPDVKTARKILKILALSGADQDSLKGLVAAQSQYLAATIYDRGLAGQRDTGKAFKLYRAASNNRYGPAAQRHLEMMVKALSNMSSEDRLLYLNEIETVIYHWKWRNPRVMKITGDLYQAGWFEDPEGFYSQYHWRLAAHYYGQMGAAGESVRKTLQGQFKVLSNDLLQQRLEKAVQMAIANRDWQPLDRDLHYIDFCF